MVVVRNGAASLYFRVFSQVAYLLQARLQPGAVDGGRRVKGRRRCCEPRIVLVRTTPM